MRYRATTRARYVRLLNCLRNLGRAGDPCVLCGSDPIVRKRLEATQRAFGDLEIGSISAPRQGVPPSSITH
jgi:hypothetical protein